MAHRSIQYLLFDSRENWTMSSHQSVATRDSQSLSCSSIWICTSCPFNLTYIQFDHRCSVACHLTMCSLVFAGCWSLHYCPSEEWCRNRNGNGSRRAGGNERVWGRGRNGGVPDEEDPRCSHRLHLHPREAQLVCSCQKVFKKLRPRLERRNKYALRWHCSWAKHVLQPCQLWIIPVVASL